MLSFVIAIHAIACVGLIFFVLIQQGRGGGLIESFSSAESVFGTKTSKFLTKGTTGLASTFFLTCLLLAFISVQQSKSVVDRLSVVQDETTQAVDEIKEQPENEQPVEAEKEDNAAVDKKQQN